MDQKEKIGGAHVALCLLTLIFLASLVWLTQRVKVPTAAADGYAVSVERNADAGRDDISSAQPVNINTATAEELQTLDGIGAVLAQRIVDYRAAHGPFASLDALQEVEGVGSAKLNKIRTEITLGV